MSKLVERVARRLCWDIVRREPDSPYHSPVGEYVSPAWQIPAVTSAARAAIAEVLSEMEEPSEGVLDAMYLAYEKAPELMWRAGISQFRKEIEG